MSPHSVPQRPARAFARSLVGPALASAVAAVAALPWFPAARGHADAAVRALPPGLGRLLALDEVTITTGWGFTDQTAGRLALVVLVSHAIRIGARAGVPRAGRGVGVLARIGVVLGQQAALVLCFIGTVALLDGPCSLRLRPAGLVGEGMALGLVVALHGLVAAASAGIARRRGTGAVVGGLVALVGWLVYAWGGRGTGPLAAWSPFAWGFANSPIVNGPDLPGVAALTIACLALTALTWAAGRLAPGRSRA